MQINLGGPTNWSYYKNSNIIDLEVTDRPLAVLGFGCSIMEHEPKVEVLRPNGRKDYLLIYNVEGNYQAVLEGKTVSVPANTLLLYRPGEPQNYWIDSGKRSHHCFIHFSGSEVQSILNRYEINRTVIACPEKFSFFEYAIHQMIDLKFQAFYPQFCDHLLQCLLIKISNFKEYVPQPDAPMLNLLTYMEKPIIKICPLKNTQIFFISVKSTFIVFLKPP